MDLNSIVWIVVIIIMTAAILSVGGTMLDEITMTEADTEFVRAFLTTGAAGSATLGGNTSLGQPTTCYLITTNDTLHLPLECNISSDGGVTLSEKGGTVYTNKSTGAVNITYYAMIKDYSYLTGENVTSSVSAFAKWIPTIALIVAAAIIIGTLFTSFFGGQA